MAFQLLTNGVVYCWAHHTKCGADGLTHPSRSQQARVCRFWTWQRQQPCFIHQRHQTSQMVERINPLAPSEAIWHHRNWVNTGSGNGMMPDGTKPLPKPMLTSLITYHDIHLKAIFQVMLKISVTKICLKFINLKVQSYFPWQLS